MTEGHTFDAAVVQMILALQQGVLSEIERTWPKDGPEAVRRQLATKMIEMRGGDPDQIEMGFVGATGRVMPPTIGPGGGICLRLPLVPAWMNALGPVDEVMAAQRRIEAGK